MTLLAFRLDKSPFLAMLADCTPAIPYYASEAPTWKSGGRSKQPTKLKALIEYAKRRVP
jgi:hypothetical protein